MLDVQCTDLVLEIYSAIQILILDSIQILAIGDATPISLV